MDDRLVTRAVGAATSIANSLGLSADDAVVLHNSNMLALRLLPCDVFARTALVGQHVAPLEVALAQKLAVVGAPIAVLDPRVDPHAYELDGFAITFWRYYRSVDPAAAPADYAAALRRLHLAMRGIDIEVPRFTARITSADVLLADRDQTPALADVDREVLLGTLRSARSEICSRAADEQLLHGEPHSGNLLTTPTGPRFIDFETCCRGPVEFDVAHVPDEVSRHYRGIDQTLLQECRRLILAMVAAWRWDVRDEFPNGHRHRRTILHLLRQGPPWPALGALSSD